MAAVEKPSDFDAIDRLLDARDLEQAREILAGVEADEAYAVLRIKLAMLADGLPPEAAMQRLIQLMRRQRDWPGAKDLYQMASQKAYENRQSSVALSHLPPPVKERP